VTVEEYLHGLISMIEELSRFATNCVTMGDYKRPLQISSFVMMIMGGFQTLNLKNDRLRGRYDGIKYNLKRIEQVVYDLKIRGLV
jgi:hypothetical protein